MPINFTLQVKKKVLQQIQFNKMTNEDVSAKKMNPETPLNCYPLLHIRSPNPYPCVSEK